MEQKDIPDSEMPTPLGWRDKTLYMMWRAVYPFYGGIRDTLLRLRIISHEGRQNYVLGKIAVGKKIEDFSQYLVKKGFRNHFVAWVDEGEVIGMRLLDGFKYQYHLRIFKDGEVRGHYEFTPEAHPIKHVKDKGMQERRADFMKFCGDWITPVARA